MDTSFLSSGPIVWGQIVAFALFVVGLIKAVEWAAGKIRGSAKEAVSPLTIDMAAAKLQIRALEGDLNAFKVEVARTYVTGDVIARLEGRIDALVSSVRTEMQETREAMLRAFTGRRPG